MALIPCPECGREISNLAPSCPQCGTPVASKKETQEIRVPLQTIQGTSKKLKGQILICAGMFWGGLFMMFGASSYGDTGMATFAGIVAFFGFVFYLSTKARIWWHHD